jgi:hypothetical protein
MHQNSGWFWAFFGGTGKGPRASSGCPDPTHRGSSFPHVPEGIHFEMESISQKRDYNFFPDLLSETLVWFQERVSCTSLGKGNPALPFAG